MSYPIVDQLLATALFRFFLVFGIFGFAVGVGLIVNPMRMLRFFAIMNQWVSLRRSTRWLAIPRDTGPVVQRFRRPIGAAFILLAAFSTFVLIVKIDAHRVITALRIHDPHSLATLIMESVRWCLITGSMMAIAVGIMLIFFPKALQAIEMRANRWYSMRSWSRGGDVLHLGLEKWLESYPRAMGWIIAVASLVVVVDYGTFLLAQR